MEENETRQNYDIYYNGRRTHLSYNGRRFKVSDEEIREKAKDMHFY